MNKKVSKALAAVLSAAMAASAFAMSTSASFAAGSDVQFKVTDIPLNLTSSSTSVDLDNSANLATSWADYISAEKDGQKVSIDSLTTIDGEDWQSSNTKVAKVDTDGTVHIDPTYVNQRQDVIFTKKYTATVNANKFEDGEHGASNGVVTATVTIKFVTSIYPEGSLIVLPAGGTYDANTDIDAATNKEASINEDVSFDIYKVSANSNGPATISTSGVTEANYTYSLSNSLSTIDAGGVVQKQPTNNVKTGTATVIATDKSDPDVDIQPASVTVNDTYSYSSGDTFAVTANYGEETATMANGYNITGMDVIANSDLSIGDSRAVLGDITAVSNQNITVTTGTVGDITTTGAVVVGDIDNTDNETATVGNVKAGSVDIDGAGEAEGPAVEVGNVTATGAVTVDAEDAQSNGQQVGGGDVTVGDITTKGTITLTAGTKINTMSVGNLSGTEGNYADCPYVAKLDIASGTFNLNDLLYFGTVTIEDEANVTAGKIDTGTYSDGTATPCGAQSDSLMDVDGRLTADSIKTYKFAQANGTVIVPVNSVEVTGEDASNTGVTLLVKDAKVGDILYTSTVQNGNLFVTPGVTAIEGQNTGKNVYTYSVETLAFRGVLMEQTGTVEVGTAGTTLTLSKIPFTVDIPEGVSIVWESNKPDSVKLTPSADGLSCKVDAIGYTENNLNGSNDVTVTATVYKDGKPYTALETQYAAATVDLTLTGKAPEAPANPFSVVVTNAEGEKITCAADGSTVITVPQSMAFNFAISSEETVDSFDYTVGNGSIGGTNTNTVWNGTSGSYQIYAAGAVGAQTGVYVNGIKIFTLEVADRPFESDTTLNMDLKVGQKYQFEITLDDPAAPFTFLTADGAALSTSYNPDTYPAENGKYYCSVTAQQAGRDIGVYCVIDGKTYKIFTAHTVA